MDDESRGATEAARGCERRAGAFGRIVQITLAGIILASVAACATPPKDPEAKAAFEEANDPIEPTNRAVFDANHYVDRNFAKPIAKAYRDNVPEGMQHRFHDFLTNLKEPVVAINDTLQGNFDRAGKTIGRFVVNTAFGGIGLYDVAPDAGLPQHHDADFGQTLGVWGVDEGPFIELPFLGPSGLRDAIGTGIGFFVDPFNLAGGGVAMTAAGYGRAGGDVLDERAANIDALDAIEATSVDYYATLRSLYRQRRQALVEEGKHPNGANGKGRVDVILPAADIP